MFNLPHYWFGIPGPSSDPRPGAASTGKAKGGKPTTNAKAQAKHAKKAKRRKPER
ncbi:hypothetical protein ACFVXC_06370 [Streptomyces sp. NPDC058257]|uniref:hypothetical protein n=1 Tax=Streptomyces sp. NPDC058257 TaxID=3346409 RepID=UPI0036ED31EE